MAYIPNRQPEGIPTGGQFAARHHAEGSVMLSDARHTMATVGALIRSTAASVKDRALQRRPSPNRPYSQRGRLAVAALVLAASASSLTACGTTPGDDCKPAASGISVEQTTAVTASYLNQIPARAGGGGHSSSHSDSGHSSSGHGAGDGSTSDHAAGDGASNSSSNGFRWPWTPHSSTNQQCTTGPTSKS